MITIVRCLCLFVIAIICETYIVNAKEDEKLQIETPEGCEISTQSGFEHYLTCPDFSMEMKPYYIVQEPIDPDVQQREELRSTVECSNDSSPYKYLRSAKSKRNSLELEDCPLPEHGSFADGWPNLEIFKFENFGNIQPLNRQHFSGLNNLWNLKLFINSTHDMADDIFSDLSNLTEIHLHMKNVNINVFKGLTKLEMLRMTTESRESLNNFDSSELNYLPLKTLEFNGNSFKRLTKRFFKGFPYVETLRLVHNAIDAVDANAFEPLTNLKYIFLESNELTSLPVGLFSRNEQLETVTISFSDNLTLIPSGFLSNLPNLREIIINCKLTSIPDNLIRGSTNLELLNLELNELTSIPRNLLKNHTKLKMIRLYGNEFENTTSTDLFDNKSPLTEIFFDFDYE